MLIKQKTQIGNLIGEIRQQLKLTQEELAHQLGVTFATVNRWENQRNTPSSLALKQIEQFLKNQGKSAEILLKNWQALKK